MRSHRNISHLLLVSPIYLVDSLFALLALTAWWCQRLNCQQLALKLSRWPVLASGIVCGRHYISTIAAHLPPTTKNLSIPTIVSSFPLLWLYMHSLGGPCGDIHLGHLKKNELNWIELRFKLATLHVLLPLWRCWHSSILVSQSTSVHRVVDVPSSRRLRSSFIDALIVCPTTNSYRRRPYVSRFSCHGFEKTSRRCRSTLWNVGLHSTK